MFEICKPAKVRKLSFVKQAQVFLRPPSHWSPCTEIEAEMMADQYFGLWIYFIGVVNFPDVKRMGVRNQNKHTRHERDPLKKSGQKTVLYPTTYDVRVSS